MFRLKTALTAALAAFTVLVAPVAASPTAGQGTKAPRSLVSTRLRLDGRLAAAGARLCESLPSNSITELSCQALQQTVQSGSYPALWRMSQVISDTLLAGIRAPLRARREYGSEVYATLDQYADGRSFAAGLTPFAGDRHTTIFYDDNAWAGMDLVQAYLESGQLTLLTAAQEILAFERSGQWRRSDPGDQQWYPGGIYWNTLRLTRPVQATAGPAQLALDLYTVTHTRADLQFGEKEYEWVRNVLATPAGLFYNRLSPGGTITGAATEDADALMIGDGVLLYRVTGQWPFLHQARQTAKASLARFTPSITEAACPGFDAILFRNLAALNAISSLPSSTKRLNIYASWAAQRSDPQTGAFPQSSYGRACTSPMPQAGVSGALILNAIG